MNIKQIIDTSVVWDNHACMPLRPQDHSFLPQLERHRCSGYTVVVLNIGFDPVAVDPLAALRVV